MLNRERVTDLLRRSSLGDPEALERRAETPRPVVSAVLKTVNAGRSGGQRRGGAVGRDQRRQPRRGER